MDMIFGPPPLDEADLAVIDGLDRLREEVRFYVHTPRRWLGTLRRATFARAVQGSNSIEGYTASVEDVAALLDGEEPFEADEETREAIAGYRDAMTYVLRLASAPAGPPGIDLTLVKALHFMMMKYDLAKNPGDWRPGAIWVEDSARRVVYEAPDRELVEPLMEAFVADLATSDDDPTHPTVRAAMAHLNLTMIHPFSDGNGRMARCLQTLALATGGIVPPEFSSIEEYLGRDTQGYYGVLTEVGQGRWNPERSAHPWVRYCLRAHHRQAQVVLRRAHETEALWDGCEQLVAARGLPPRSVSALCDAARGRSLRRSLYVTLVQAGTGERISEVVATRDLRALVGAGVLRALGERRGRAYEAGPNLRAVWQAIRSQRRPESGVDPYEALG